MWAHSLGAAGRACADSGASDARFAQHLQRRDVRDAPLAQQLPPERVTLSLTAPVRQCAARIAAVRLGRTSPTGRLGTQQPATGGTRAHRPHDPPETRDADYFVASLLRVGVRGRKGKRSAFWTSPPHWATSAQRSLASTISGSTTDVRSAATRRKRERADERRGRFPFGRCDRADGARTRHTRDPTASSNLAQAVVLGCRPADGLYPSRLDPSVPQSHRGDAPARTRAFGTPAYVTETAARRMVRPPIGRSQRRAAPAHTPRRSAQWSCASAPRPRRTIKLASPSRLRAAPPAAWRGQQPAHRRKVHTTWLHSPRIPRLRALASEVTHLVRGSSSQRTPRRSQCCLRPIPASFVRLLLRRKGVIESLLEFFQQGRLDLVEN